VAPVRLRLPTPRAGCSAGPRCSPRKWRLFGCACCRRLWPLLDYTSHGAVEVAERFADRRATLAELKAARQAAEAASLDPGYQPVVRLLGVNAPHAASWAAHDARALVGKYTEQRTARGRYDRAAEDAEGQAQRDLLQDLLGRLPCRPVATDPAWLHWRAGAIPKFAQAVYEERAFDRLPVLAVLADALEEAGSAVCRGSAPSRLNCGMPGDSTGRGTRQGAGNRPRSGPGRHPTAAFRPPRESACGQEVSDPTITLCGPPIEKRLESPWSVGFPPG
jgi:hypothetical protein